MLRATRLGPSVGQLLERELLAGKRAAREAVDGEARRAQQELRDQVRAAFGRGGNRLANTWRLQVYPQRPVPTLRPKAQVLSRAPNIIDAFDRGVTIRARGGRYLAIPLEANRRGGLRTSRPRVTPAQMVASRAAFVLPMGNSRAKLWCLRTSVAQRRGRGGRVTSLAIGGNLVQVGARGSAFQGGYLSRGRLTERLIGQGFVPMFLLLPQVRLNKRLDIARVARGADARLIARMRTAWAREARR